MEPHLPADSLSLPSRYQAAAGPPECAVAPADGPDARARREARTGLYVHVPFCARRCSYCDFSTGDLSSAALERYLGAFEREAARREGAARGAVFSSVFFGGGTPSALAGRHFARLWKAMTGSFDIARDAEITLEANPESVRPALLDAWAAAGVNRLSMGAQTWDLRELQVLGRIHGAERPAEAFALARRHGFRRLSLDLMFGFPGHSMATWTRTLEAALALEPEHLSAYCFIPEADTPLGRAALRGECALPSPDAQADLYDTLVARARRGGYAPYETSNFARPGAECRHNLVYWLRRDYLGLGPSAHGLWRGVREANPRALESWAAALESGAAGAARERETAASRAEEIVMLGLRLAGGLVVRDYDAETWCDVERRYGTALREAVTGGRIERMRGGWRVAARHRFVADDVIAWLMARATGPRDGREGGGAHLTGCGAHP